ncbi:RND family transporter [Alteromonadaceae bacterium M269]|nr:RND family transporter [Alteromonadaceae bacterium M269]
MKEAWLDLVLKKPWTTLLIGLLFVVGSGFGAKNLYFRGDYRVYFKDDNPQKVAFDNMQNVFTKTENADIIISPKSGDVFNQETLRLISEMTIDAWQIPLSSRVDSVSNFQHTWSEYDDMIVEDLILEPELIDDALVERVRSIALEEPNLVSRLISKSGDVSVISITVNLPEGDQTEAVTEISAAVNVMVDEYKQRYPNHDFYLTGVVFLSNAFNVEAQKDASTLVPLMFLAILVILWFLLRSFIGTLVTLLVIVTSIVSTMGIGGWSGIYLSTATVNVPTIVMTLAVADCVHVISSMIFRLRQGDDKYEALRFSMEVNVLPIFITSITTAIGFLILNFSEVPVLADLGNLTAIGVMIAFVFAVTILPSLLILLPFSVPKAKETSGRMERFGEWVIQRHRMLIVTTTVLSLAAISLVPLNKLNDVPMGYFSEEVEFRQAVDFQEDKISGMSAINFALFTNVSSGLNDPEVIKYVDAFSHWLREQPEVDHVSTITDTFKRLNKNMHSDDESYYRLPEDQELAAQYILLYEFSLPYGLDLNNQLDIDKSATRLVVTMQNLGSKEFTEFERRAIQWIEENTNGLTMTAGSPSLMFAHVGEANMSSMIQGTLVALILISGLLIFALRSWRLGLISLLPNLLPAGIGFGIWALYSAQVNLGLSIVLSMVLGIIVDDTVHFLSKYQHARVLGKSAEDAVRYAFTLVGRALCITTAVLAVGFGVLALSSFALNAHMGLLTAIIIVVALVIDFLFLPAFLMIFDRKVYAPLSEEGLEHA